MGIRSLTSFVEKKEGMCFSKLSLKNSALIIDGNGLCAEISIKVGLTATYGGDYDRFGTKIDAIFALFAKCNIVPIVIFDGAMEKKKIKTILTRVRDRVKALGKVHPGSRYRQFFPLALRSAMKERLSSLGVTIIQSDFEADREIAALAKKLDAPVLGNDSDFYIYDVRYIPIRTVEFKVCNGGISCQIFSQKKFLSHRQIVPDVLPLLAAVLGNDYISPCYFIDFFGRIPKTHGSLLTTGQRKIQSLLAWLKHQTFDSAFNKILQSFPSSKRKGMRVILKKIIKSYTDERTIYLDYIPLNIIKKIRKLGTEQLDAAFEDLNISDESEEENSEYSEEEENSEYSEEEQDSECSEEENPEYSEDDYYSEDEVVAGEEYAREKQIGDLEEIEEAVQKVHLKVPEWVLEESRLGRFNPDILSILNLRIYLADPQIEDYSKPCAFAVALPLIQLVAGLMLGDSQFSFWQRNHNRYECTTTNSIILQRNLTLENIAELSQFEKRKMFLKIFELTESKVLRVFPKKWMLFIFAMIYWAKAPASSARSYHIHALILMLIAMPTIEQRVGYYRNGWFLKRNKSKIKSLQSVKTKIGPHRETITAKTALGRVNSDQCLLAVESILQFFQADRTKKVGSNKLSTTVHSFSEFQACLNAVVMLNDTFGSPFPRLDMTKFYNGTFLCNITTTLQCKVDHCVDYLTKIFDKCGSPSLTVLYLCLVDQLKPFIPIMGTTKPNKPRNEDNLELI